jgi:hypothetical protein
VWAALRAIVRTFSRFAINPLPHVSPRVLSGPDEPRVSASKPWDRPGPNLLPQASVSGRPYSATRK